MHGYDNGVVRRAIAEFGLGHADLLRLAGDDHRARKLREIACGMSVIGDHCGMVEAARSQRQRAELPGAAKAGRRGYVCVKVSAPYRVSKQSPTMQARALHETLVRANPERLMGTPIAHIHRYPPR